MMCDPIRHHRFRSRHTVNFIFSVGNILEHPTLGGPPTLRQPSVAYTLLVPANIRATTRRYWEISRTQIALCHASVRQLRYPSIICLPIVIKFAFSLWCQSFYPLGLRHRISRDCENSARNYPENAGDCPIGIHNPKHAVRPRIHRSPTENSAPDFSTI